jgi:hypothetical protein
LSFALRVPRSERFLQPKGSTRTGPLRPRPNRRVPVPHAGLGYHLSSIRSRTPFPNNLKSAHIAAGGRDLERFGRRTHRKPSRSVNGCPSSGSQQMARAPGIPPRPEGSLHRECGASAFAAPRGRALPTPCEALQSTLKRTAPAQDRPCSPVTRRAATPTSPRLQAAGAGSNSSTCPNGRNRRSGPGRQFRRFA